MRAHSVAIACGVLALLAAACGSDAGMNAAAPVSGVDAANGSIDRWPFGYVDGGFVSGDALGYEYAFYETDVVAMLPWSGAVVVATVGVVGAPQPHRLPEADPDAQVAVERDFADHVQLDVHITVDEVVAGPSEMAGSAYVFVVGARKEENTIYQFEEAPVPAVGEQYLMFLRPPASERSWPEPGGEVVTVGAGASRVPLERALELGLLDQVRAEAHLLANNIVIKPG